MIDAKVGVGLDLKKATGIAGADDFLIKQLMGSVLHNDGIFHTVYPLSVYDVLNTCKSALSV